MAINSSGDAYFTADPTGAGQCQIFKLDAGIATFVAEIGGYAGPLAFDSQDNLYYASQTGEGVMKFSVDDLGVLDMSVYDVVLGITAGYIGFDEDDNFYATTGWGAAFSQYDLTLGTLVTDIAYGGVGQFVIEDGTIYLIDTDWVTYASTVYRITPVITTIAVPVEINPQALRVNLKGKSVITVRLSSTDDFNVADIDMTSISLDGAAPVRSSFKSDTLVLKFKRTDVLNALETMLGNLDELENNTDAQLSITAMLMGQNIEIEGSDYIRILKP
jgi:hypothetical protein